MPKYDTSDDTSEGQTLFFSYILLCKPMQLTPISKCPCIAKPVYRVSSLFLYYCMVEFVDLYISLSKLRNLLLDFPY